MPAILIFRKQEFIVKSGIIVRDAMLKLDFEPDAVIPTRDGELIPYNELIGQGEMIRLVPVISGGRSNEDSQTALHRWVAILGNTYGYAQYAPQLSRGLAASADCAS